MDTTAVTKSKAGMFTLSVEDSDSSICGPSAPVLTQPLELLDFDFHVGLEKNYPSVKFCDAVERYQNNFTSVHSS